MIITQSPIIPGERSDTIGIDRDIQMLTLDVGLGSPVGSSHTRPKMWTKSIGPRAVSPGRRMKER